METWTWVVPSSGEAVTLRADRAILTANPPCTRSQLQRLIDEGAVTANGEPVKAGAKLSPGATVEIRFPPPKPLDVMPEDRPIEILYQDEHLLVVNKPPGLTVHPSSTQTEGTLVNILLHHVRDLSGIGGKLRPGIVHRIDKDTSGALVITKTDEAHHKLVETFSKHDIDRVYWALCYGVPKNAGTLEKPIRIEGSIGRSPTDRKKMALLEKGGRHSVSLYYVRGNYRFASLVEVRLETGRTHQIRVHLTSIGHSILGDPVYGTPTERQTKWTALPRAVQDAVHALPGQALHAGVLGFTHPITGEKLRFEAKPPEAFSRLMGILQESRS